MASQKYTSQPQYQLTPYLQNINHKVSQPANQPHKATSPPQCQPTDPASHRVRQPAANHLDSIICQVAKSLASQSTIGRQSHNNPRIYSITHIVNQPASQPYIVNQPYNQPIIKQTNYITNQISNRKPTITPSLANKPRPPNQPTTTKTSTYLNKIPP